MDRAYGNLYKLNTPFSWLGIAESEEKMKMFEQLEISNAYDLLTFTDYDKVIKVFKCYYPSYLGFKDSEYHLALFTGMQGSLLYKLLPPKDFLPDSIRFKRHLPCLEYALWDIHWSMDWEEKERAKYRLAFDELFLIQVGLRLAKRQAIAGKQAITFKRNGELFNKVYNSLPFRLTSEQEKVMRDIARDMESPTPMRRLVQGDVGSGKTVVSMLALVKAVENGYQGALLAPTEILATQHYDNFVESLSKFGIRVGLLSAKVTRSKKLKEEMYNKIVNHEIDIVVGTHAMVQDDVKFARLGLAITDEQHRFGVSPRAKLSEKSNITPDVLSMSATPIPRTIALTFYGDLDVSRIEQLPAGRKPVQTTVKTSRGRRGTYSFVRKEILKGRQAYVVCPSRGYSDTTYSVEELYDDLVKGVMKDIPCALIHGKMKEKEKNEIMSRFKDGEIKLIVSTTVIEVGVNVPNATVIVIEDADRFGLAQLHQLRGRVGRGSFQSHCFLISNSKNEKAQERLALMERTTNGFELAEEDLKLRGAGQFFGEKQFGMPDLKLAGVFEDMEIFWEAHKAADEFMEHPEFDKYIDEVKLHIRLAFKDRFEQINNI